MRYITTIVVVIATIILSSCGDSERCFDCTLRATSVEVCESNFQALAAQNNLVVNSLDEYLDLIGPNGTGFTCVEIVE